MDTNQVAANASTPFADGSSFNQWRMGQTGEQIMGLAHALYAEPGRRGKIFAACTQSVATFGTALTATMVTLSLTNPVGSGTYMAILSGGVTVVTSTTAGSIVWALGVFSATAVTHTTPVTPRCMNGQATAPAGLTDTSATLPAAPIAVRTLAFGPVTATASTGTIRDYVDGAIVLTPGTSISVQGITIVGTGLIDICWEEITIVSGNTF